MRYRTYTVLPLLALLAVGPLATAHAAQYTLTDLGDAATVDGLSTRGTVVGSRRTREGQVAAIFVRPGTPRSLTIAQGGRANGVAGEVVVGVGDRGAFYFTVRQGIRFLDPPPQVSTATDVNEATTITGYGDRQIRQQLATRPQLWINGQPLDLPTLGGRDGHADAINSHGDAVGDAQTAAGVTHAALWPVRGGVIDLDPSTGPAGFSIALAINDRQHVTGVAVRNGVLQAFVWTPRQGLRGLGTLPGHLRSQGRSINTAGVIVGSSTPPGSLGTVSTAIRIQHGQLVDLNTLITAPGWHLQDAAGINEAGQIAGVGTLNGVLHAYLLTPHHPHLASLDDLRHEGDGDVEDEDGPEDAEGRQ
jgi:uncharacterized membrane protein